MFLLFVATYEPYFGLSSESLVQGKTQSALNLSPSARSSQPITSREWWLAAKSAG